MAALPIAQQQAIGGQRIEAAYVAPTDLGLSKFGDAVEAFNANEDELAQDEAQRALTQADGAYEGEINQVKATYDGSSPGFSQGAGYLYDQHAEAARRGLSDRAQGQFDKLNTDHRTQRLSEAVAFEGEKLGAVAAAQVEAERRSAVALRATEHLVATMDAQREDMLSGAMLKPDYPDMAMKRFDESMQSVIDQTPEVDKPAMLMALTQQKQSLLLEVHSSAFKLREDQIKLNVDQGLKTVSNAIQAGTLTPEQGLQQGLALTRGLPIDIRQKVEASLPDTVYAAGAAGLLARGDDFGLEAYLNRPEVKAGMATSMPRYLEIMQSRKAAGVRAMAQDAATRDMESELASLAATGQSTGFDPQSLMRAGGPEQGPLMVRKFNEAKALAIQDHQLISQANSLPQADYIKLIEAMKPAPGAADYAVKQARYERALNLGGQLITQRAADPAGVMSAAPDTKAMWTAVEAGTPGAASAWANAAVSRQKAWGVADGAISLLPDAVAKSMVSSVLKAEPAQRDEAMRSLLARAMSFGPQHGGRVIKELQAQGLPGPDAAVMIASEGDPVLLGQYTVGQERAKLWKGSKDEVTSLTNQVQKAIAPLTASYGHTQSGAVYGDNLFNAALTMAKGNRFAGMSDAEAAQTAVKLITRRSVVDEKMGYRLPPSVASGQVTVVNKPDNLYTGMFIKDAPQAVTGQRAVQIGAQRLIKDYGLYRPQDLFNAGNDALLGPDQKRKRLGDRVLDEGRFVNTEDGSGLMLVINDPAGGVRAVLDAKGRPIVATWDQLKARAGKPEKGGQ